MSENNLVTLATRAMATRFEIVLWGGTERFLNSVGEETFAEIERLEAQLSLYRDDSDIFELNARAALHPVKVEPRLYELLAQAKQLSEETEGAFDITVAPLMQAWGLMGGTGEVPTPEQIDAAREVIGMHWVELNPEDLTVRFLKEGVMLDLGAIGKGYAIEYVTQLLRDYEVGGALIHGGTSTIQAIGTQPDGSPWSVAIQHPSDPAQHLTVVPLQDRALSVSALHGKFFTEGDTRYGHVIDPRTGQPVQNALLAAVVSPSATESDALSTALLTLGESFLPTLCQRPETGEVIVNRDFQIIQKRIQEN